MLGSQRKSGKKGRKLKEIMPETSPNVGRNLDIEIHKAHRSPKISSPRQTVIKSKTENLKTSSNNKKFHTYRGTTIRLPADFSADTLSSAEMG